MSRIMIRIELVTHVDAGDVFNDLQKTEKGQKKKKTIYLFIQSSCWFDGGGVIHSITYCANMTRHLVFNTVREHYLFKYKTRTLLQELKAQEFAIIIVCII